MMPSVPSLRLSLAAVAVSLGAISLPATADDVVPVCPANGSTVLREFDTAGGYHTRIAYYSPTPTETNVCIQTLGSVQTVIAVTSQVDLAPPEVTQTWDSGHCPGPVVTLDHPDITISAGGNVEGRTVCFGIDGTTSTITIAGPTHGKLPTAAVWLPANSFVNQWGWCGKYYAAYQTHKSTSRGDSWRECYEKDNRIG